VYKCGQRENVCKPLFEELSLIHAGEWSSRLECYNRPMTVLRSDPQWCSAMVVRLVGVDVAPGE